MFIVCDILKISIHLLPIRNQSESLQSIRAAFTALRKAKKTDTDMQSGGSPVAKNKN
jgi:hypothetical protein